MNNSLVHLIQSYVEALRPIIYLPTSDYDAINQLIEDAVGERYELHSFNLGEGYIDFYTGLPKHIHSLEHFLEGFLEVGQKPAALILRDVHHVLHNETIQALLQSIALKQMYEENYRCVVFMTNSRTVIPPELDAYTTIVNLPPPTDLEIEKLVKNFGEQQGIAIEENTILQLRVAFKGLSKLEIMQILNLAYQKNGKIESNDRKLILKEKEQFVRKSGMLEIVDVTTTLQDIGGLENFKEWLKRKANVYHRIEEAVEAGLDIPKGTLITGVPGTGKSLAAKATAAAFNVPLLRLDLGKLMGKYVGESEENLHKALRTAEAVSPCILWIDEIEKSFIGVGKSEVTTRLFGTFLTWMQEKQSHVFIVATANDISGLPPEFLRKGRFDELFMVDLPSAEERQEILKIHLLRRNQLPQQLELATIVQMTEGYSGADLEAIVREAVEEAFLNNQISVTTDQLQKITKEMASMSEALTEKVNEQRQNMQKFNLKQASKQ